MKRTYPKPSVTCGTFGCILADRHKGLHIFPTPMSRCRSRDMNGTADLPPPMSRGSSIGAAELLIGFFNAPPPNPVDMTVVEDPVNMTVDYDIEECFQICAAGKPPEIIPKELLPSLRIKRRWSAAETGFNRACWYKGKITKLSGDKTRVYINYDDGDKQWENLHEIVFL